MRSVMVIVAMSVALVACGGDGATPSPSLDWVDSDAAAVETTPTLAFQPPLEVLALPLCDDVKHPAAPDGWYGDSPVYIGNEMPLEAVRTFASGLAGYENIWIDREHNGWITVGYVGADLAARQAALQAEFPEVGVVAVEMERTAEQLDDIRRRISDDLPADMNADNMFEVAGYVEVWVGSLTSERIEIVRHIVGDEPACLSGSDPGLLTVPGPQPEGGDGWTYLTEIDVWLSDRPVVIADPDTLGSVWDLLGFEGETVDVDFGEYIVVGFGVDYSGSCPATRFDGIGLESDLLSPLIVHTSTEQFCTADANPRTYLIAIQRDRLPAPPFRIARGQEADFEITIDADLRIPDSAPAAGDVTDTRR